jgi:CBS domain-containing protein
MPNQLVTALDLPQELRRRAVVAQLLRWRSRTQTPSARISQLGHGVGDWLGRCKGLFVRSIEGARGQLRTSKEKRRMNIQEIMSQPAVTCRPNDTLNTAAQLMWEHDCGAIPVVNDDNFVVGMITDRDICMATYTRGSAPREIQVADTMANEVFSCHAGESLEAAERLMSDKQVRRIPVVDDGNHPVGLLSLNDIARHAASLRKKNGIDREVTQTLAAICQPAPPAQEAREAQSQSQAQQEQSATA